MKKLFIQGISAGLLAAFAGSLYFKMYQTMLDTSFDKIISIGPIIGASLFGCILMSLGYFLLQKFKKENLKGFLNIIIVVLSFASIISAISMTLPLEIQNPELFPGLAVPMHFFPALAFLALEPFFRSKKTIISAGQ